MKRLVEIDYETRSKVDLKKSGAYRYAEDESTDILCLTWLDGLKLRTWSPFYIDAQSIKAALALRGVTNWEEADLDEFLLLAKDPEVMFEAHNAQFEYVISHYVGRRLYGFPEIPYNRFKCSAAKAAALALPRDLETVGQVLGAKIVKDSEGKRIMQKMSKPRKPTKKDPSEWNEGIEDFTKLIIYNVFDVLAENAFSKMIPDLTPEEEAVYYLDFRMNNRGVYCDVPLIHKAISFIEIYTNELNEKLQKITNGEVRTAKQVDATVTFLAQRGVVLEDGLTKDSVEKALKTVTDPIAKEVLEIRKALALSSVSKLERMLKMACEDYRIRGMFLYCGAARTGRWAGRGVQLQNLPRGDIKDVDFAIECLEDLDYEDFTVFYPDVLKAMSGLIRSMLKAPDGKILRAGDFSAVEVRVLFWLADHQRGLDVFRQGKDIYIFQAADLNNVPYEKIPKKGKERQFGKTVILGCLDGDVKIKTEKGLIPIKDIKREKVWNGKKFVEHQGNLATGRRKVMSIKGESLTWLHPIYQDAKLQAAVEIGLKEDMKLQRSENISEGLQSCPKSLREAPNAVSWFVVIAAILETIESTRSSEEKYQSVINVLRPGMEGREESPESILISLANLAYGQNGLLATTIYKKDAITPRIITINTMALKELSSYLKIENHFLSILSRLTDGKTLNLLSIELIPLETMKKVIFDLCHIKNKLEIEEVNTYDLIGVDGGLFETEGGLLAHNCGYNMGEEKFFDSCHLQGLTWITKEDAKRGVDSYRTLHAPVKEFWGICQSAAMAAIQNPGQVFNAGKFVRMSVRGKFLFIRLPSGRKLAYFKPRIEYHETKFGVRPQIVYDGIDSKTKKWGSQKTYGGKLVENITQAAARDFMVFSMQKLEAEGHDLIMTVHDEAVTEDELSKGTPRDFENIMKILPEWGSGCPIGAEAFQSPRYKK